MKWQDKGTMIFLGNKAHDSDEDLKKYHDYVLTIIDDFDGQAIDMFITNTSIIPNEINNSRDFYQVVYDKITKIIENIDDVERLTLRCMVRLDYLELILKGEMK